MRQIINLQEQKQSQESQSLKIVINLRLLQIVTSTNNQSITRSSQSEDIERKASGKTKMIKKVKLFNRKQIKTSKLTKIMDDVTQESDCPPQLCFDKVYSNSSEDTDVSMNEESFSNCSQSSSHSSTFSEEMSENIEKQDSTSEQDVSNFSSICLLTLKKFMIDTVMVVFKKYKIALSTLYLTIGNINRYLNSVKTTIQYRNALKFTINEIEDYKVAALIILNLSSKYCERVAFKVSELSLLVSPYESEERRVRLTCEELRMQEFTVLKALDYRIGGQTIIFEQIVKSLNYLEVHLPITFSETLSTIKSKANQISLNYIKEENVEDQCSNEVISSAAAYLAIKIEEKRIGFQLISNECFQQICNVNEIKDQLEVFQCVQKMVKILDLLNKNKSEQ
eukprot:403339203